ncbi:hypothetical protein [Vitreimonas sp.]|uniref:hypothetical protein n=1 Tax=Vitreimonas sp. TaxID=3069702 RepID=UPI002EDB8CF7
MRMHAAVRWLLIIGALLVGFFASPTALAVCAFIVALAYMLLGLGGRLSSFLMLVSPIVLASAALWIFVLTDGFDAPSIGRAATRLLDGDTNFIALLRALTATSLILIAIGAIRDGETYAVMRAMALPKPAAFVFASGAALVESVREAVERSIVALRAQGLMKPTFASRSANLGRVVGLTWLAGLNLIAGRAETKWSGNRFIDRLQSESMKPATAVWDSLVGLLTFAAITSAVALGAGVIDGAHTF